MGKDSPRGKQDPLNLQLHNYTLGAWTCTDDQVLGGTVHTCAPGVHATRPIPRKPPLYSDNHATPAATTLATEVISPNAFIFCTQCHGQETTLRIVDNMPSVTMGGRSSEAA